MAEINNNSRNPDCSRQERGLLRVGFAVSAAVARAELSEGCERGHGGAAGMGSAKSLGRPLCRERGFGAKPSAGSFPKRAEGWGGLVAAAGRSGNPLAMQHF